MGLGDQYRQVKETLRLKFVKDTIWVLVGNIVLGVFGILVNVVLVTHFGAEGLGQFALAFSVYLVAHIVALLGLDHAVTKFVSEAGDDQRHVGRVLTAALALVVAASGAVTAAAWAARPLLAFLYQNADFLALYTVLLPGLPLFAVNKLLAGYLNGVRDMKAYAVVQAARYVLVFAGINALYAATGSLATCGYAVPAAEAVLLAGMIVRTRLYRRLRWPGGLEWFRKLLGFGFYSCLHGFVVELNFRIDILVVGHFLDGFMLGVYAFASDVAKGLTAFSVLVQVNFNPIISRLWAEHQVDDLKAYIARVRKSTYLMYVPIVVLAAAGYPVFIYLFKPEMAVAPHFAAYYILLGGVFVFSGYSALLGLLAFTGNVGAQLRRAVCAVVVNAAGSLILVPVVGIIGAATSTCLALVVLIVYTATYAKTQLGIRIL